MDETVLLDSPLVTWMMELNFQHLSMRGPNEKLIDQSYQEFLLAFRQASSNLGLMLNPTNARSIAVAKSAI